MANRRQRQMCIRDRACLDCDWKYEEKDGVEYRPFEPVKAKLDEDWTMEDE